jgi:hypothetical protein
MGWNDGQRSMKATKNLRIQGWIWHSHSFGMNLTVKCIILRMWRMPSRHVRFSRVFSVRLVDYQIM